MAIMKPVIRTSNKELYNKLNMLYFSMDVVIKDANEIQVDRILKNINKKRVVIDKEIVGDYIILHKKGPLDFLIYFTKK